MLVGLLWRLWLLKRRRRVVELVDGVVCCMIGWCEVWTMFVEAWACEGMVSLDLG